MNENNLFQRRGEERGDLRLIEQAIRHKWEINPALFKALPNEAARIALDPKMSPRDKINAIRLLVKMDENNNADKPAEVNINHRIDNADNPKQRLMSIVEKITTREDIIDITPKESSEST